MTMTNTETTMNANDNARPRRMYERTYGAKYNRDLDTAAIAKLVREDIKAALKSGALPRGLKTSVKTRRFAGGSAIDLVVTACPFRVTNPERVIADIENPHGYDPNRPLRHTDEARALLATLEGMLQAYNHDGSDSQTDYYDVNFYGHADFAGALENEEREEIRAEYEANAGWTLPA